MTTTSNSNNETVINPFAQAISILGGEQGGTNRALCIPRCLTSNLGYTRLGAVESFRDELRAEADNSPKKQLLPLC